MNSQPKWREPTAPPMISPVSPNTSTAIGSLLYSPRNERLNALSPEDTACAVASGSRLTWTRTPITAFYSTYEAVSGWRQVKGKSSLIVQHGVLRFFWFKSLIFQKRSHPTYAFPKAILRHGIKRTVSPNCFSPGFRREPRNPIPSTVTGSSCSEASVLG